MRDWVVGCGAYGEHGCGVGIQGRKVWAYVEVVEEKVGSVYLFEWVLVVDFQDEVVWDGFDCAVYHLPISDGCVVQCFGVDLGEVVPGKRGFVYFYVDVSGSWRAWVNHWQLVRGYEGGCVIWVGCVCGFGDYVQWVGSVDFRPQRSVNSGDCVVDVFNGHSDGE